jgi:citronellol/citronellal dehydrogenase
MNTLKGKTILVTGASRGIGLAIALRFAMSSANIVILSKDSPQGLQDAATQLIGAGGQPLVLDVDVTDVRALKQAVTEAVDRFGGIDVLVNNTSATCFTNTLETIPEKFDLALSTSVRAAYFLSQACLPHLKNSSNPHIINISPPLNIDPHWFKDHLAFSIAKYAMSLCTLGMAEELRGDGIAVNSLWPESTIATQTIKDHFSPKVFAGSRWPSIMGDAAFELLSRKCTGHFFTDEFILKESGMVDFSHYAVDPSVPLMQALFIPLDPNMKPVSQDLFLINNVSLQK